MVGPGPAEGPGPAGRKAGRQQQQKSNFPNTPPKSTLTPPKNSHAHFPLKNGRETGKNNENKSKRVQSYYISPGIPETCVSFPGGVVLSRNQEIVFQFFE